ncbi:MAG: hypothetical protein ACI9C4_002681 [Paraglaciecola sp.]|jgi:hypothetical protein
MSASKKRFNKYTSISSNDSENTYGNDGSPNCVARMGNNYSTL